jgi:hypothetical protein
VALKRSQPFFAVLKTARSGLTGLVSGPGAYWALTCLVREVRYNVNLEARDEDVVWIGEDGPYRHHIG